MTAAYVAMFAVGAIAVLTALLLTDFDLGAHHDGLPFLSLTGLSAGLIGAGTGGLISSWAGLPAVGAGAVALGCGVTLMAAFQYLLLPYLRRQEGNSHRGRADYIGRLGTVTLEVAPGGWGEVTFLDADGNRVHARAVTAETAPLAKSTRIYIADVDADVVHVVAVPES